jgi:FMN phosphatase YigB (HAD superfamily)
MANKYDLIGLDIYGTVLCTDDYGNELPPRRGIECFFEICKSRRIKVVSISDADPINVRLDLSASGVTPLSFDHFFYLNQEPSKDLREIFQKYRRVRRDRVLIIGDNYQKDILAAKNVGCPYIHVPEYKEHLDDFDFSTIPL